MVIKVYLSLTSGSMEIKKKQELILRVLQAKGIRYEEVDVSDPTLDTEKQYMREHSRVLPSQKFALPPQVFNDDAYCGDYEMFHEANEDNALYEFLKMAPEKNISQASVQVTAAEYSVNGTANGIVLTN